MKVSELEGRELNFWAMKAWNEETGFIPKEGASAFNSWEQVGQIIEREKISIRFIESEQEWIAIRWVDNENPKKIGHQVEQWGPTPLVAAMRCYVASKFGEEVDETIFT